MIRALHVLPHRGGGAERYIDMLERMPETAHRRLYLSSGRTPASALRSLPLNWPRLVAGVRGADLLHAHGDVASLIALPLLRARPAVVTTHGLHMLRRLEGPQQAAMARAVRGVGAAARAVICTSSAERDELARVLRSEDAGKLTVIHNGIDPPRAAAPEVRESVRAELGVDDRTVLGLFVGQLEPRKAPLLAAAATARARGLGVQFALAVAGDGPQAAELAAMAAGGVMCLGYRTDLARLYAAADVFVQPSEREGMSLALLEAMSYGLAVIAADGPGNPEAIGDTGLLFAAGDERALATAVARLGTDAELRDLLGEAARARVLAEFSAERFVAATGSAYNELLG